MNLAQLLAKRIVKDAEGKLQTAAELKSKIAAVEEKQNAKKSRGLTLGALLGNTPNSMRDRSETESESTAGGSGEDSVLVNPEQRQSINDNIEIVRGPDIPNTTEIIPQIHPMQHSDGAATGMSGEAITYSGEQQTAIRKTADGESFVLIGPAGSGKTTTSRGCINALLEHGDLPPLPSDHKYLGAGTPGAVICSFTRRAVANIRKVTPRILKPNCVTIHKLLEYQPVEEWDANKGKMVRRFKPNRNASNKLSADIKIIVIEECGMVSTKLFEELIDALPNPELVQFIFIGDIYQLPPCMGDAILGFKMLELDIVELTRVYRQGADSPIISLAWEIKQGDIIAEKRVKDPSNPLFWNYPLYEAYTEKTQGLVEIRGWKKQLSAVQTNNATVAFVLDRMTKGQYDPEQDIILCPFEKPHGKSHDELVSTVNINTLLANELGKRRGAIVFEINARGTKSYYAVGDRVLVDKEDGVIVDIKPNKSYVGEPVQEPSASLSRNGVSASGSIEYAEQDEINIDDMLEAMANEEDVTNAASHVITVRFGDGEDAFEKDISSSGDINGMLFAYAITVYKAQGSEWRRVFVVIHKSHAVATCNEMLYTAVTRAREELIILCEGNTFKNGVMSRKIRGNTLEAKAEWFKGKVKEMQSPLGRRMAA